MKKPTSTSRTRRRSLRSPFACDNTCLIQMTARVYDKDENPVSEELQVTRLQEMAAYCLSGDVPADDCQFRLRDPLLPTSTALALYVVISKEQAIWHILRNQAVRTSLHCNRMQGAIPPEDIRQAAQVMLQYIPTCAHA